MRAMKRLKNAVRSRPLFIHGALLAVCFYVVARLAPFLDAADPRRPPTAGGVYAFVVVLMSAGAVWFSGCLLVRRGNAGGQPPLLVVMAFTLIFRLVVFTSPPILELEDRKST